MNLVMRIRGDPGVLKPFGQELFRHANCTSKICMKIRLNSLLGLISLESRPSVVLDDESDESSNALERELDKEDDKSGEDAPL